MHLHPPNEAALTQFPAHAAVFGSNSDGVRRARIHHDPIHRQQGIPAVAGLPGGIHLHTARHAHAAILLKQNTHPKVVQERLGHASIATTLDLYSSVVPGIQRDAAQRFDLAMNASPVGVTVAR